MVLTELKDKIFWIILNRVEKHNAFNEELLDNLHQAIQNGLHEKEAKILALRANGHFFSAGADLQSMKKASSLPLPENIAQAQQLANVLAAWHQSSKPTFCLIQGSAFGGALGFIAASDMSVATTDVKFCFSEAKLGLIPAVISPYILEVIGLKCTKRLFLSAETFNATQARDFGLIDEVLDEKLCLDLCMDILKPWTQHESETLSCIKHWLMEIHDLDIDSSLIKKTAEKLAEVRLSPIAKTRLNAFLTAKK
jgi:methylglutaconyl-CoA hydratase